MKDAMLSVNGLIQFPVTGGLTGEVYKNPEKIVYYNKFNQGQVMAFQNNTDNIKSIQNIANIAFFAMTREDRSPIGMV